MAENFKKYVGDRKRFLSFFLVLFFIVVILLFGYFEAKEIRHECCGGNCPVCAILLQYEKSLRHMDSAVEVIAVLLSILLLTDTGAQVVMTGCVPADLITWKVRLNP